MENTNLQYQIDDINRKLDMLLEYMHLQQQRSAVVEDLVQDVTLIGNDFYKNMVIQLDNHGVEIDMEEVNILVMKLMKNIGNINAMLGIFESILDFAKDFSPIFKETGINAVNKLHELEQKGYIDFVKELMKVGDKVITNFAKDDINDLAENIVTILETVKNITQPDMLLAMNNAVGVFKNIEMQNVPEITLWKAMKELRTPEIRRGLGFMITFLKNLANNQNIKK